MKIVPYLSFNGSCKDALKFYEQVLGGKVGGMMTWGESPMANDMPKDWHDKIMHAYITIDGAELMAADAPPSHYKPMQGIGITLNFDDTAKAKTVFEALSSGGDTTMPFQESFWAEGFGMCKDKFGTPWMVNGAMKKSMAA